MAKKPVKKSVKRPVGRPRKYTAPEKMQKDIEAYFAKCEARDKPKTIMGLALALNMCRDTLCEYAKTGEFSDVVKRAKDLVVAEVEEQLLRTTGNIAGPIFWLKNHGGMADRKEITGPDGGPIEVVVKDYKDVIDDDED